LTNKSIFENTVFDLPLRRGTKDVYTCLSEHYSEYVSILKKFKKDIRLNLKPRFSIIENQIELTLDALDKYLNGFPAEAFSSIQSALEQLDSNQLLPIQDTHPASFSSSFYRVRVSDNANLKRKDLFHIPFELREKVSTQRYSIPGLPCLYMADSIFVCWEEMGRPSINRLYASRFDISNSALKLLYFNISSKEMRSRCFSRANTDGKLIKQLVTYLCFWPLLAACSLLVEKPSEVFKPEYIVPQLVLQWVVLSKKIDGVYYKSNRVKVATHNMGTFSNIVLPIQRAMAKGYCPELSKKIKLTAPVSFEVLDISGYSALSSAGPDLEVEELRRASYIELIDSEKSSYLDTKFGILESKLKKMTVDFI